MWKDKHKIKRAVASSRNKSEALILLGVSPKVHTNWKKLNLAIKEFAINLDHFQGSAKVSRWASLPNIIMECYSISEVLERMGLQNKGSNWNTARKRIHELNLDTSHFRKGGSTSPYSLEEIFCKNSAASSATIRRWVKKEELIQYVCARNGCGNNGSWLGSKLQLQLEHIDGDRTNNELSNLEYLCPNCHTQTSTWGSKRR